MQPPSKTRVAIALLVLAAMVIPPAGTELRIALERLLGPPLGKADRLARTGDDAPPAHPTPAEVAAGMPRDVGAQFAAVVDRSAQATRAARSESIRQLARRFPDDRFLCACVTLEDLRACRVNRPDLEQPLSGSFRNDPRIQATVESARTLETDAVVGARLDPDNALFAFAQATALFTLRRDAEALEALERAGHADRWDDYADQAERGTVRLNEARFGALDSLDRLLLSTRWNIDDGVRDSRTTMEEAARVAIGWAVQLGEAHETDEALRIRASVARYGGLMRRDGHAVIDSLAGCSIEATSLAERHGRRNIGLTDAQRKAEDAHRLTRLVNEFRVANRPDLADGLVAGHRARMQTNAIVRAGVGNGSFEMRGLLRVVAFQIVIQLLLLRMLISLATSALAGACGCASRRHAMLVSRGGLAILAILISRFLYLTIVRDSSFEDLGLTSLANIAPSLFTGALAAVLFIAALLVGKRLPHRKRRPDDAPHGVWRRHILPTITLAEWLALAIVLQVAGRENTAAARDFVSAARHDGRFYAARIGRPWPEAVTPKF